MVFLLIMYKKGHIVKPCLLHVSACAHNTLNQILVGYVWKVIGKVNHDIHACENLKKIMSGV